MSARATWIALAALFALVATSGCSILNAPDRNLIPPTDGGNADRNMEGGPFDAGDGGMADGGPDGCVPGPENCNPVLNTDLNCNGLRGCADYECAALPMCCTGGTREELWDWSSGALADRWNRIPSSNPLYPSVASGRLGNFNDTAPQGVVSQACVPLAAGKEIRTSLVVDAPGCDTCFASIALTPARDSTAGMRIDEDIAVTLYGNGQARVTRAGEEVGTTPSFTIGSGRSLEVSIQITVGADLSERPSILATVVLTPNGESPETVLESRAIATLEQLHDQTGECIQVPGEFIAAEGVGSSVSVDDIELFPLQCVNPSQFTAPATDPPMTADELGWGAWTAGGIAAPAIVTYLANASDPLSFQWHVLADATDQDRTLDPVVTEFGYAIGHSAAGRTSWGTWRTTETPTYSVDGDPRWGACSSSTCSAPGSNSVREPSAVPEHGADELTIAYAARMGPDVYGIAMDRMASEPRNASPGVEGVGVAPGVGDLAGCRSLRDPMLVARRTNGYWLFFTCEQTGGRAEIHVVGLTSPTAPPEAGSHRVVLAPSDAAPYGAGAVRAPEVILELDPDDAAQRDVYRMWFTAQPAGFGESTIAVATAQVDEDTEGLPAFVPYPANPVLTSDERALGPACTDCQLLGIAVTQIPNREGTYRFLVARSVNDRTEYELRPLDQFWRPPWPPGT